MVCLNKSKQCNAWRGCVPDYSIWFVDRREYTTEKDSDLQQEVIALKIFKSNSLYQRMKRHHNSKN
jgi:hypothetical protein